jgi:hypothetical protein
MMTLCRILALALLPLLLAGCGAPPPPGGPPVASAAERAELAGLIAGLSPSVAPAEAARAADVALDHSRELAVAYGVEDPPLLHNVKVNMGLKPRGLCYEWADDLQARLAQEGFATLQLHRAIANYQDPLRVQHSTVILSAAGQDMMAGVVLDPWRAGGDLYWAPVVEDTRYNWTPQNEVFAIQIAARERRTARAEAARDG